MKKKATVICILIFAVCVAAVFVMPRGATDVERLDVCVADTRERVETEGDSALVQLYNCGFDCELYTGLMLNIRSSSATTYALTNKAFADGQIVEPRESANTVVIDRLEDDKWVRWRGLDFEEDGLVGRTYAPIISEDGSDCVKMFFPAHQPGRYRITLSFRDARTNDQRHLTTGGETHSVSFCYDVSEWQNFGRFKATASIRQISKNRATVAVVIDSGDRVAPFRDTSKAELTLVGSTESCDAYAVVSENSVYVRNPYLEHYGYGEDQRSKSVAGYLVSLDSLDMSKSYDLTLHFAENEDGSGEQYTLTLNLRFDEVVKE